MRCVVGVLVLCALLPSSSALRGQGVYRSTDDIIMRKEGSTAEGGGGGGVGDDPRGKNYSGLSLEIPQVEEVEEEEEEEEGERRGEVVGKEDVFTRIIDGDNGICSTRSCNGTASTAVGFGRRLLPHHHPSPPPPPPPPRPLSRNLSAQTNKLHSHSAVPPTPPSPRTRSLGLINRLSSPIALATLMLYIRASYVIHDLKGFPRADDTLDLTRDIASNTMTALLDVGSSIYTGPPKEGEGGFNKDLSRFAFTKGAIHQAWVNRPSIYPPGATPYEKKRANIALLILPCVCAIAFLFAFTDPNNSSWAISWTLHLMVILGAAHSNGMVVSVIAFATILLNAYWGSGGGDPPGGRPVVVSTVTTTTTREFTGK
eukprot:GHVQ01010566.1.p1 GENE.GHVQ01010566.1~~GHVQ01010566.1.p1  ORF type:complete len:371 (+),score=76.28 GHVQ01010566.1:814-1926(+)